MDIHYEVRPLAAFCVLVHVIMLFAPSVQCTEALYDSNLIKASAAGRDDGGF